MTTLSLKRRIVELETKMQELLNVIDQATNSLNVNPDYYLGKGKK